MRRHTKSLWLDGYTNHRVIVFDAETGAFKRMWGAFGNTPVDDHRCPPPSPAVVPDDGSPGPAQFGIVHAVRVSNDGFVYVADREHKRVQVFTIEGTFVSQVFIGRSTPDVSRTASSLDFSADAEQQFLYIAGSRRIVVLNRHTLEMIGSIETGRLRNCRQLRATLPHGVPPPPVAAICWVSRRVTPFLFLHEKGASDVAIGASRSCWSSW